MHFQNLDLNLLVALDALLEERSVSRAAERLYLTQSATSSALNRLREYFADDLLVTVGRRMEPTALALTLAPQVRQILHMVRATIESKPNFDPASATRCFNIMTSDYLTEVLLAKVIRQLARSAPHVQMQVFASGDAAMNLFLRGEMDLLITPDVNTLPEHPQRLLFDESFSCVVWRDNTQIGSTLTIEQYFAHRHVGVRFGSERATLIEQWCIEQHRKGLLPERRVEVYAPTFGVMPHLVVGTDRIATMHSRHARLFQELLPLRVIPAPAGFPVMREMIQWPRHLDSDPAIHWLIKVIMECAAAA